jgi:hypothetical protein
VRLQRDDGENADNRGKRASRRPSRVIRPRHSRNRGAIVWRTLWKRTESSSFCRPRVVKRAVGAEVRVEEEVQALWMWRIRSSACTGQTFLQKRCLKAPIGARRQVDGSREVFLQAGEIFEARLSKRRLCRHSSASLSPSIVYSLLLGCGTVRRRGSGPPTAPLFWAKSFRGQSCDHILRAREARA